MGGFALVNGVFIMKMTNRGRGLGFKGVFCRLYSATSDKWNQLKFHQLDMQVAHKGSATIKQTYLGKSATHGAAWRRYDKTFMCLIVLKRPHVILAENCEIYKHPTSVNRSNRLLVKFHSCHLKTIRHIKVSSKRRQAAPVCRVGSGNFA